MMKKLIIAVILIMMVQTVIATCENYLIQEDIGDIEYYRTEKEQHGCAAYYDSYDGAYEAYMRVIDDLTERKAKLHIIRDTKFKKRTYRPQREDLPEQLWLMERTRSGAEMIEYKWVSGNKLYWFYADEDFVSKESKKYYGLLEEYMKKAGSTMDEIFLRYPCSKWEKKEYKGHMIDVCTRYEDDTTYNGPMTPMIHCDSNEDCPGSGEFILTGRNEFIRFACRANICTQQVRVENHCVNDRGCVSYCGKENSGCERYCNKESIPYHCVECRNDDHCEGRCEQGRCVAEKEETAVLPEPEPQIEQQRDESYKVIGGLGIVLLIIAVMILTAYFIVRKVKK